MINVLLNNDHEIVERKYLQTIILLMSRPEGEWSVCGGRSYEGRLNIRTRFAYE